MPATIQAITFEVQQQLYGIDVRFLQEILPILRIKPIVQGPNFLEGIINLRGQVIPIADLRKFLGATQDEYTFDTRIIVACIESHAMGFIVDHVRDVKEFVKEQMSTVSIDEMPLIENVITLESGQMLQLITLEHILGKDQLQQLHNQWDSQL